MRSAYFRHTCLVRRTNDRAAVSSLNMLPKAKRPSLPLLPLGHTLRRRLVGTLSSKRLPPMADQTSRGIRKPTRRDLLLFAPRGLSFAVVLSACSLYQDGIPERSFPLGRPHGLACTLSCSGSLFQLRNARSPPRAFPVSPKPTAGRPWAPAVAQEAQGRFRLTPLREFSPLRYSCRTSPL